MQSYIYGTDGDSPSTSATQYNFIHASALSSWNNTQTNRDTVVPHDLTLDRLRVEVTTAPGVGRSWTFALMKNGAATGLTCTISGANTSAEDLSNTVSYAAGDTISIRSVPSGTPSSTGNLWWSVRQEADNLFAVIGGAAQNASNTATNYNNLMSASSWVTTDLAVQGVVPCPGVFSNLTVQLSAAPSSTNTRSFEIWVNNSSTGVVVSFTGTDTFMQDTVNTVSVSAGDTVSLRSTISGTPTAANVAWSCSFNPDTDGQSFLVYGDSAGPNTSDVNWEQPMGRGANQWVGAGQEINRQIMLDTTTMKAMYVALQFAPGSGGDSFTFNARIDEADTSVDVPIVNASTTGNITGQNVSITAGEKLSLQCTPAVTPGGTSVKTGILFEIAVAPTGATYYIID